MQRPRFGFTLLEVVAALVLMGTLVASALVSLSAYRRQLLFSRQRSAAVKLADEMLAGWYGLNQGPPVLDRGIVESNGTWFWRTQPVGVRRIFGEEIAVIRFDLSAIVDLQPEPVVLVSVEILHNQFTNSTQALERP